jgi:hypothetical protein
MTTAIPVKFPNPGDSLENAPASAVILTAARVIDVTGSCEFGVGPGVRVIELVCVSQTGSSPSFTIGIDGWDPASGTWENLVTSATISTAATTVVQVNPYGVPITNSLAQRACRRRMRATVTYTSGTATGSLVVHAH